MREHVDAVAGNSHQDNGLMLVQCGNEWFVVRRMNWGRNCDFSLNFVGHDPDDDKDIWWVTIR